MVKLLLEREEVNPVKPNGGGRTPLSSAAGNGNEGVVKLLLERDEVNPDRPDKIRRGILRKTTSGRTPLSYAAGGGYLGVVKLLLEREEVNPDTPDHDGRMPLLYAA